MPTTARPGHRDPAKEPFWRQIVAEFDATTLSVREFYRQRGLSENRVLHLVAAPPRQQPYHDATPGPHRHSSRSASPPTRPANLTPASVLTLRVADNSPPAAGSAHFPGGNARTDQI